TFPLFLSRSGRLRALHSFPTRRSSDLEPYVNYTDEVVAFTNNLSLLHSFMTKFDDLWTSTTEFANYANVTGPLTRSFPIYPIDRSEEHTSELQSLRHLVCRLLLEKKK